MIRTFNLYFIEICPDARFIRQEGIKNGDIFLGLLLKLSELILIPSNPPIPEPTITPALCESISEFGSQPESSLLLLQKSLQIQ